MSKPSKCAPRCRSSICSLAWLWGLLGALGVLLGAFGARAAPARPPARVAIQIEGPQAALSRDAAVELMPDSVEVIDESDFRRALAVAGLPGGNLGYALGSPRQRPTLLRLVRRAVRNLELGGALVGRTRSGPKGLELVVVYVEAEGEPLIDTTVSQRGGPPDRRRALEPVIQVVADVLAPRAPEPEPEPAPEPSPEPTEPAEEDEPDEAFEYVPNRAGSELVSLGLGLEFGGRFFSYSDALPRSENLRDYDVFGVPIVRLTGELYPGATTGVTFVRDLGLTLEYSHALGLSSATADGRRRFGTTWNRFWGGLRYRFRAGDEGLPFVIALSGRAGFHRFTFAAEDAEAERIANEVAEVEYVALRAGLDARLPFGEAVALLASLGYVGPLDGGATYERFRDHSLTGMDAALALAVTLGAGFDLRFGAQWGAVFASLSADPADSYVADGATDHSLALDLGLGYVY